MSLRLTLDNGQMFERAFYAYLSNPKELEAFYQEMLKELAENGEIMCEIWKEIQHIVRKRCSPTKEEELAACIERGGVYQG
ncbi:MAG: hypothetical protein KGL39_35310 [Patescibacteria group bacterium]|nr:hypothetical protein [Patescibacteria group bacterium]